MKKLLYLLLLAVPAFAQNLKFSFRPDTLAPVSTGGRTLTNAWAGGLNAAQYSRLHLDADTLADLVVFDRAGGSVSTFLAVKQGSGYVWRHAPQYETQFPTDLTDWMLLVDYDGDGRRDLFTRAVLGIRVFRNATTGTGPLRWEKTADPVQSLGFSGKANLYVAPTDIPGLSDVDGDGDLDVLAFDQSGNFVEFHRNESIETTGKRGLTFRKIDFCWGNFIKEHCKDFRFDFDCQTGQAIKRLVGEPPPSGPSIPLRGEGVVHAGNSLLVTDLNGDGLKDALFGHITCQNIAFLPNSGTLQQAIFKGVEYEFPTAQPILFQVFPAVFQEDFDFDGKPDLVAAPNTTANEGDLIDYRSSNWFYRNTSTGPRAAFALQQKDFLQNTMVDLGENAAPLLVDLDGDGDLDLLVGYGGVRGEQGYRGSLAHYRNAGTRTQPRFEWQTDDYLGLAQRFLMTDVKPFVADLNGDRLPDLGFVANSFTGVQLRFLPNRGGAGGAWVLDAAQAVSIPKPTGLTPDDAPVFTDVDGDGRTDLLVAKLFQNLEYHRNTGTGEAPAFTLVTAEFGGTREDFSRRGQLATPTDLDGDGNPDLLLANGDGSLRAFRTLVGGAAQPLRADTLFFDTGGASLTPTPLRGSFALATGDLNGDGKPDLLVGTVGGGMRLWRNTSAQMVTSLEPTADPLRVFPNPTDRFLTLQVPTDGRMEVLSLLGQTLVSRSLTANQEHVIDLGGLARGVYLLRVQTSAGGPVVRKIVLGR